MVLEGVLHSKFPPPAPSPPKSHNAFCPPVTVAQLGARLTGRTTTHASKKASGEGFPEGFVAFLFCFCIIFCMFGAQPLNGGFCMFFSLIFRIFGFQGFLGSLPGPRDHNARVSRISRFEIL